MGEAEEAESESSSLFSLHCQHGSCGHKQHCGFVATKLLLTSSVIPAQKNALIWCSGLMGSQHVLTCPWKMLVVGGNVACGPQTRSGETSVLPQVSLDASLVCHSHCSYCPLQSCTSCRPQRWSPPVRKARIRYFAPRKKKNCHEHCLTCHWAGRLM